MQQYFICTTHFILYYKSENTTLQYFIFCEKVLDKKYLLKLDIQQAIHRNSTNLSFLCLRYVPFCVLSFIHSISQLRMPKKDCYAYQNSSYLCCINTQKKYHLKQETSSEINFEFIKFVKIL